MGEWPEAGIGRVERRQAEEARRIHGQLVFDNGVGYLVTDDGVIQLRPRPGKATGGWSEYGYEESSDEQEKRGRMAGKTDQAYVQANEVLTAAFGAAVRDSKMTSYASAFPEIAETFARVAAKALIWFRLYLKPETDVAHGLERGPSEVESATAAAYAAMAAAIAESPARHLRTPPHLRDAIEIALNRLWLELGEIRRIVKEPQEVIVPLKAPDDECAYCGKTVKAALGEQEFEDAWRLGGGMTVGDCAHSFYDRDEWRFYVGEAGNRVITFRQVCDVVALYARFREGFKGRIHSFADLPEEWSEDSGDFLWNYFFSWRGLEDAFGIQLSDAEIADVTTWASLYRLVASHLRREV